MPDDRLACDGGPQARSRPDSAVAPVLGAAIYGDAELEAVSGVVRRRQLWRYRGSTVNDFEAAVARRVWPGARALAVNSGTSALHLIFAGLDLPAGSRVLLPTFGFVSAATAAVAAGLRPIYTPVDRNLGADPGLLPDTSDIGAVVAVHAYGSPCDLDGVRSWVAKQGCVLIEDAAQCFGGSYGGTPVGSHGLAAAFSFQHFKVLSTGEGGMVLTADSGLADRVEVLHDAASAWTRPAVAERVPELRGSPLNLRMGELEGALGLAQLARVDSLLATVRHSQTALLAAIAATDVGTRPVPAAATEVGSSVLFYAADRAEARWIVHALTAEGVRCGLLIGDGAGANRHWAGHWDIALTRAGVPLPSAEHVAHDRAMLDPAVHIAVDIEWNERDLEETCAALDKVLSRRRPCAA